MCVWRRDQRKRCRRLAADTLLWRLRIQERIAGDKSPSELFFCDSIEGTVEMARAGFGAAIIPEIFVKDDDKLEKYKISGHEPLSVGLYYRAEEGNEPLRQMAKILKELSR